MPTSVLKVLSAGSRSDGIAPGASPTRHARPASANTTRSGPLTWNGSYRSSSSPLKSPVAQSGPMSSPRCVRNSACAISARSQNAGFPGNCSPPQFSAR